MELFLKSGKPTAAAMKRAGQTITVLRRHGLDSGLGAGLDELDPGQLPKGGICVEQLINWMFHARTDDSPECVDLELSKLKISFNDSKWESPKARARALEALALAQLGSKGFSRTRTGNPQPNSLHNPHNITALAENMNKTAIRLQISLGLKGHNGTWLLKNDLLWWQARLDRLEPAHYDELFTKLTLEPIRGGCLSYLAPSYGGPDYLKVLYLDVILAHLILFGFPGCRFVKALLPKRHNAALEYLKLPPMNLTEAQVARLRAKA